MAAGPKVEGGCEIADGQRRTVSVGQARTDGRTSSRAELSWFGWLHGGVSHARYAEVAKY